MIVREWSRRAFAGYDHTYWGQFEWSETHWHVFGVLVGRPVCYAKLTWREALADRRRVTILGLGGLGTDPDHQGRGFGTRLMAAVGGFLQEQGADLGLLVCDSGTVSFYEKCGWQEFGGVLLVRNHGEELVWPKRSMVLPRVPTDGMPVRIDLCGPPF